MPKSNEQSFSQIHMVVSYAFQICDTPIQVLLLKHVFLRYLKNKIMVISSEQNAGRNSD